MPAEKSKISTLKKLGHPLASAESQLEIIENSFHEMIPFQQKMESAFLFPLKPLAMEIFQVNLGKMCNQACRHCHVDAGPDRKEIMTQETMMLCLDVLSRNPSFTHVDLTGGAPEMNPGFRWFVEEIKKLGRHVMVRCNLTIIMANKKYHDLPQFYAKHNVEVISSLPFYSQDRTDRQRGEGVFNDSIKALKLLNDAGYGLDGSGLILNLVYNPAGAFLPPSQQVLEKEFKEALAKQSIYFNNLFAITNMPVSRYLDYLLTSGNYENYMEKLALAFNPVAAAGVMCRNTLSVGWDGYLYDCDFNQMLELKVNSNSSHLSQFNFEQLQNREIILGQHCYGCTAGSGSGCGGATA
jgi:radical SAM/Cys-rich protein